MSGIEYRNRRIPCRLIIFDKDGTLIDFRATWVPIVRERVATLTRLLARNGELEAYLLRSWGIDPVTGRIDPLGPLVVTQRSAEITIGTLALYQNGYSWNESNKLVAHAFDQVDANTDRMRTLRPADGIQELVFNLKRRGFSLALATSDERRDTEAMLSSLHMESIFDKVLCAGEATSPKPNAESILAICRQLSIDPKETIFVGDSMADMIMGKNAGIALTIGVLQSGVTPREELEKVADVVIDTFGELRFY